MMKKPQSVRSLEELGRVRLSKSIFMRDFLYSEISQIEAIPNVPDYPDVARETGLSRATITLLYKETAQKVDPEAIEKLCLLFKCQVGDLLELTQTQSE